MDLIMISFVSFMTALACLVFAFRIFRFDMLMRAHWMVDIIVTAALMMFFSGTLQGTVIAAMAGLIFSLFMTAGRMAQTGVSNVQSHRPPATIYSPDRHDDENRGAELDKILGILERSHERQHRTRLHGHQLHDYGFLVAAE